MKALACSSAAFTCTEHWNTLRCYSGITKETWLCTKSRAGAMLAAYGYFLSFCKAAELEAPCGRWNVPGAAGTCLRRRNARKTQHAALAAVCIRPPSGGRQLLMLLSRCNVTFSSLLLLLFHWPSFLSAVALLFPPPLLPYIRLPEMGIPTGKNILSEQPPSCIFSCFLIVANPSFTKESFFPVLCP